MTMEPFLKHMRRVVYEKNVVFFTQRIRRWWWYLVAGKSSSRGLVRVSVCVRLHYVHWWPDCDIIWTYLALFRCSAVFRLSGLLAPGNSLLLSAHYRDLMRRNHHQVHTSYTSLLCLASIFNIYIPTRHSHQLCKIIGNSGIILRLIECDEDAAVAEHSSSSILKHDIWYVPWCSSLINRYL